MKRKKISLDWFVVFVLIALSQTLPVFARDFSDQGKKSSFLLAGDEDEWKTMPSEKAEKKVRPSEKKAHSTSPEPVRHNISHKVKSSILFDKENNIIHVPRVTFVGKTEKLSATGRQVLKNLATELSNHPDVFVRVEAYTDSVGSDQDNLKLTERMADQVKDLLTTQGVSASRIQTVGKGDKSPVADSETLMGQVANRRLEFHIQTPPPPPPAPSPVQKPALVSSSPMAVHSPETVPSMTLPRLPETMKAIPSVTLPRLPESVPATPQQMMSPQSTRSLPVSPSQAPISSPPPPPPPTPAPSHTFSVFPPPVFPPTVSPTQSPHTVPTSPSSVSPPQISPPPSLPLSHPSPVSSQPLPLPPTTMPASPPVMTAPHPMSIPPLNSPPIVSPPTTLPSNSPRATNTL